MSNDDRKKLMSSLRGVIFDNCVLDDWRSLAVIHVLDEIIESIVRGDPPGETAEKARIFAAWAQTFQPESGD